MDMKSGYHSHKDNEKNIQIWTEWKKVWQDLQRTVQKFVHHGTLENQPWSSQLQGPHSYMILTATWSSQLHELSAKCLEVWTWHDTLTYNSLESITDEHTTQWLDGSIKKTNTGRFWDHTFLGHAHSKAFLQTAVLAPVASDFVDDTTLVFVTHVLHVLLYTPTEETLKECDISYASEWEGGWVSEWSLFSKC